MKPRHAFVLALVALALPLAACGKQKVTTFGDTEGTYVDVGPLAYQVQLSRQLNPTDSEDRNYLAGVPADQRKLAPNEVWFAVFVRVQNTSSRTQPAADDYEITDTVDNRFRPVPIATTNPFAYKARDIGPGQLLPSASSPAGTGPVQQGSLLLFKLTLTAVGNRPLELHIRSAAVRWREAHIDLDV